MREAEKQLAERDGVLLDALGAALRARDPALLEHGERVAALSARLARRLRLSTHEVAVLERAIRVHDVGKLAFPDRVLAAGSSHRATSRWCAATSSMRARSWAA